MGINFATNCWQTIVLIRSILLSAPASGELCLPVAVQSTVPELRGKSTFLSVHLTMCMLTAAKENVCAGFGGQECGVLLTTEINKNNDYR